MNEPEDYENETDQLIAEHGGDAIAAITKLAEERSFSSRNWNMPRLPSASVLPVAGSQGFRGTEMARSRGEPPATLSIVIVRQNRTKALLPWNSI